jgi:hypothetical protein
MIITTLRNQNYVGVFSPFIIGDYHIGLYTQQDAKPTYKICNFGRGMLKIQLYFILFC